MSEDFNKNKAPQKKIEWLPAITLFFKYSSWIIFPLIIGLYVGGWLDKKYNTEPWMFLGAIGVAFLVSMTGLVIEAFKEFKRIEKK